MTTTPTADLADTLWRLIAIVDLVSLLTAGTAIHVSHRRAVPKLTSRAGWGFGSVLVVITVAITANALAAEPLTLGQRIVTAGITPAAIYVGLLVALEVRRGWQAARDDRRARVVEHADQVADVVEHIAHADPCSNPECIALRAQLIDITAPGRPRPRRV